MNGAILALAAAFLLGVSPARADDKAPSSPLPASQTTATQGLPGAKQTTLGLYTDGMEGDVVNSPDSVFLGQHLVNGWKNSGLPWTYDVDPRRMILPAAQ